MDIKSGIKTTEFWRTVLVIVGCFVLFALGKLESVQDAIGAAVVVLGALGYSISRGMAKKNGSRK